MTTPARRAPGRLHARLPGRRAALWFLAGALAAAAATPAAAPIVPTAHAEDAWSASLPKGLGSGDPTERDAARRELLAKPNADEVIVGVLRSAAEQDQAGPQALTVLAELAGERNLQLANSGLRLLLRDVRRPLEARRAAAKSLEKTGSIADVGALGDALRDVPDASCRALVAIGGDAARAALLRGMGDAPPPEALAALAKFGDASRLRELASHLDDPAARDRTAELLRWATGRDLPADAAAWRSFLDRRDLAARFEGNDANAIQQAVEETAAAIAKGDRDLGARTAGILADPAFSPFARAKAALAIGLSGLPTWNDALLAACANGQPGDVRWSAGNALARVGDLSCAAPLLRMLVHDEDRDRVAAKRILKQEFSPVDPAFIRALHRIGVRGCTSLTLELLAGDYRTGLHRDALRAFAEVSGGNTFGFQPDGSQASRVAALEPMRAWWREARETLPIAPRKDDPGFAALRKHVDALVAELGMFKFIEQLRVKKTLMALAEFAEEPLVRALASDDTQTRIGAADTMEGSTLRVFAAPLAARLTAEPNAGVRTKLLNALETCGRRDASGVVPGGDVVPSAARAALADRDLDVRIAAARVIGVVGEAADVERLRAAAAESKNRVEAFRAAAAGARLLLGDRSAVTDLCAELRCDDVARQADAVRMLRAAKVDVHGFDPDAAADARETAVRAIEGDVSAGGRK